MARIVFKGLIDNPEEIPENKIQQGDFVYCKSISDGALSFWGIYSSKFGVVSLDGAGNSYIPKIDLYLYGSYNYWRITKRIKYDDLILTIEEKTK